MSDSNKILKNTGFLYIRMLLVTIVSLYTSRVTLQALGVTDYGIYMLIGGFVAIFAAFANIMAGATQRFLTFYIGQDNPSQITKVFSVSLMIHIAFSLLFIIVGETIGLWFVNNRLEIPDGQLFSANVVYQLSLFMMILIITQVPYNAVIIAYEKMSAYSIIGIVEVSLKLILTSLLLLHKHNVLVVYAILMFLTTLVIRLSYYFYVKRHFKLIRFNVQYDIKLIKEMSSFAGWSLLGTCSYISINQAIPILLNTFFGVVVNAAIGLANQISGTINQFVTNFQTAFKPQIIKNYAINKIPEMLRLVEISSKLSFYLLLIIVVPLFPSINLLMHIWLPVVPDYTISFCKLVLLYALIDTLTIPIWTAIEATGQIKIYQLFVGVFFLCFIPVSYIILKLGANAQSVLVLKIIFSIIIHIVRLRILKHNINLFSYKEYASIVCLPIMITSVIPFASLFLPIPSSSYLPLIHSFTCFILTSLSILILGLSASERKYIFSLAFNITKQWKIRL